MEMSQWNTPYSYLKQKYFFFYKNREQEGKIGPVWKGVGVGGGGYKERVSEGEYSCLKMEKWDLLKLFQE
jgi:hypothetical protein